MSVQLVDGVLVAYGLVGPFLLEFSDVVDHFDWIMAQLLLIYPKVQI